MTKEDKTNQIIEQLCKNGWAAYIAGGAARDILRGVTPEDYDVVTNAPYHTVKELFKDRKLSIVGANFSVCIIDGIEVSTFRKNARFDPAGHKSRIEKADSIREDLSRRDLTINAMAFCPYNGDIVDEFGGLEDLRNKIIRFTGNPEERIEEDPCRILRACRFLAMLEGRFAPETLRGLRKNRYLVKKYVAPERIRLEIIKSLKCTRPSLFFDALHDIGILGDISPGFETCFGHDGGSYHGETIDKHIKLVGDFLPARKPLLRLAGYFHDHGKPAVAEYRGKRLSFINHAEIGADMVEDEMKKLKFSLKEIAYVTALTRHHMRDINTDDNPKTVRRTLKVFQDAGVDWKDWFQLKFADTKGNLKKKDLDRKQIKQIVLNIHHVLHPSSTPAVLRINNLAINGEDVMKTLKLQPGPEVGRMLKRALDYVLDDPERNTYEKLVRFITDAES